MEIGIFFRYKTKSLIFFKLIPNVLIIDYYWNIQSIIYLYKM